MPLIRVSDELKDQLEAMEIGSMKTTINEMYTFYVENHPPKAVLTPDDEETIKQIVEAEIQKLRGG